MSRLPTPSLLAYLLLAAPALLSAQVSSLLNGVWEIAQGPAGALPAEYAHTAPVPGLVDMAEPAFEDVGLQSPRREVFYYRRSFSVAEGAYSRVLVKINKAKYGMTVYCNGSEVGRSFAAFTPVTFDLTDYLAPPGGGPNELVIAVGAHHTAIPRGYPDGWELEKVRYIPGIFDDVELVRAGPVAVEAIQVVPTPDLSAAEVFLELRNGGSAAMEIKFGVALSEATTGEPVHAFDEAVRLRPFETRTHAFALPIPDARAWSPEDPFLYRLRITGPQTEVETRFGLRTFAFDPAGNRALFNGEPMFLRGTTLNVYRFFEDPARGALPWDRDWVRLLFRKIKEMHLNSARVCIGFPPDFWYDIADEEGVLLQDEFPIWYAGKERTKAQDIQPEILAGQYTTWMRERWNHPSVVIWDAQNETMTPVTGHALSRVRHLDRSGRPWNNGWAPAMAYEDVVEAHPYLFSPNKLLPLEHPGGVEHIPLFWTQQNFWDNPVLINEYAFLWLGRDGRPTHMTRKAYDHYFGPDLEPAEYRRLYAYWVAALTEKWRHLRRAVGVLHLGALGYDIPEAVVGDNLVDVDNLVYEPQFRARFVDAMAPLGVMLDFWRRELPAGAVIDLPVSVINDHPAPAAFQLELRMGPADAASPSRIARHAGEVPALGKEVHAFEELEMPTAPGSYRLEAVLRSGDRPAVRSIREFSVKR